MRFITRIATTAFFVALVILPISAKADTDYETGDGWVYQDGTLTITDNGGLKDFVYNEQDPATEKWMHKHSVYDVSALVIGKQVTELSYEVYDCNDLTPSSIAVEPGNAFFIIDSGWVVNKVTNTLFSACNLANKESVESIENIPAYIEHIGARAFYDYENTKHISIPQNVVSIGDFAFDSCTTLRSVSFPRGLQSIGARAFYGCQSLEMIQLGAEVNDIGIHAFGWCPALKSVDIRETKIEVLRGDSIGATEQLKSLELPSTVELLEASALNNCSALETLVIHSDGIVVESSAFRCCDNLRQILFTSGKPSVWGNCLFEESGSASNGKGYISSSYERNGDIIPYPTLYYTAAYANEWAPNGETEWNGYQIQQISQEELDAVLAEARGEATPTPAATPTPTTADVSAPEPTASSLDTDKADRASLSTPEILLLSAIAAVIVGIVFFAWMRGRKVTK